MKNTANTVYVFNEHVKFKFDGKHFHHTNRKPSAEHHDTVLDHIKRNVLDHIKRNVEAVFTPVGTRFDLVADGGNRICVIDTDVDNTLGKIENHIMNAILMYEAKA